MIDRTFTSISTGTGRVFSNDRIVLTAMVILFAGGLYQQLTSIINHDTAWYLYATGKFLDGAKLYVDIVEVNPPLAFYLTVPGVLLSRATGLSVVDAFVIYVFTLIAMSLFLTRALLLMDPRLPKSTCSIILLTALVGLAVYPTGSFGQREHLMLILTLPYLFLASLRARRIAVGPGLAVVVGGIAALGFALKPHFLIVPVMIEIYLLATTRRLSGVLRPESASLGAAVLIYLISIMLVTPEYLTTVVPYAFEVYNNAYRNPLLEVIDRQETALVPMVLLLWLATRHHLSNSEYIDVMSLAAGCLYSVYLIQMKGWSYQLYPSSALVVITLFVFLASMLVTAWQSGWSIRLKLVSIVIAVIVAFHAAWVVGGAVWRGGYQSAYFDPMLPLVPRYANNSSIYVFTTNVSTAFPLVTYADVVWSSRFPALWMLPGLMHKQLAERGGGNQDDSERLEEIRRYVIDAVVEDMTKFRPSLVIVDERADKPYFQGMPFDYIDFFESDSRFRELWSHYERIAELGGFGVYVDKQW